MRRWFDFGFKGSQVALQKMRGADKSCDRENYKAIVGSFPSSSEAALRTRDG
jgi:hypothetical protein